MVDRRHREARVALEHLAEPVDVRRLHAEVELALERVGEMADDRREVDEPSQAVTVLGLLGEQLEQAEVAHDLLFRAVALHLDDDAVAALERRRMHLADRPGGERLGVDAREHVLPRHAELLLHDGDDLFLRHRRHVVLELRELGDELGRQQVRPRGEDLAELRERRPQLLECCAEALRALLERHVGGAALAEAVARHHLADERGTAEKVEIGLLRCRSPAEEASSSSAAARCAGAC